MANYFFKLASNQTGLREFFPKLFKRISVELCEQLFSAEMIFFSGNNKNLGQLILVKIKEAGFAAEVSTEAEIKNFSETSSVIFPHPEKEQVYDIINFHFSPPTLALKSFTGVNFPQSGEKITLSHPEICRVCQRESPEELGFCLYCGKRFSQKEVAVNYSLKITEIEGKGATLKLAKYLQKYSEQKDFQALVDCLTFLPTIFNLTILPARLSEFTTILDKYQVIYEIFSAESFRLDKLWSRFVEHGTLNLGTIKRTEAYFDPGLTELACECLKNTSSESLRKAVSLCLYESFKIIEHIRSIADHSGSLFENIETEIDSLLNNFFHFSQRANSLSNYLEEKYPEKINQEIFLLKKQGEQNEDKFVRKNYQEALEMKERELQEIIRSQNNLEVIKSLIISISSTLGSLRARVTGLSNYDLVHNKGAREEVKKIRDNLTLRLNSIQEVLELGS